MKISYWNGNGHRQEWADRLFAMIPAEGPVKNGQLERFRKASNAYYDIFNNGGGNRAASIAGFFGKEVNNILREGMGRGRTIDWDRVSQIVDPKMDKIIFSAGCHFGFQWKDSV